MVFVGTDIIIYRRLNIFRLQHLFAGLVADDNLCAFPRFALVGEIAAIRAAYVVFVVAQMFKVERIVIPHGGSDNTVLPDTELAHIVGNDILPSGFDHAAKNSLLIAWHKRPVFRVYPGPAGVDVPVDVLVSLDAAVPAIIIV